MNVRVCGTKTDVSMGSLIMDQLLGYVDLTIEVLGYGIPTTHQKDHIPEFGEQTHDVSELEFE